jgi:transcription termination factor NusB|tara:strand:- start:101 stop:337 length:237 start_codon:yes stop_codon:yes gene_type:complete
MGCMNEKKKMEKDIQEILEAKQNAHNYCRQHLEGVIDNMQKLREQIKKPKSIWNVYSIDNKLIHYQVLLNEVIKHLKK